MHHIQMKFLEREVFVLHGVAKMGRVKKKRLKTTGFKVIETIIKRSPNQFIAININKHLGHNYVRFYVIRVGPIKRQI